ncbi:protein-methionine-sulfoxide reductase heme-binding subunit MsrQ [Paremcibacter congregatus]|uniref:sulfite oxidase heme-binding subunit YedZ n=1 Tax=Paremcibacter congregatus TaxID=2043170 RepID=UPI0030EEAB29|tara:strand:+ start:3361 stop:3975 length:615 start_codon:yes stop_codon:yes gene_type:complete
MRLSLFYQKAIVHLLALLPALWLFWQGWLLYDYQDHDLTANPIQYINQYTGDWAIRLILLGLAITPLRQVFGWNRLIQFRRMIGLYAFFYVMLHLVNFMVLDHFFDWATIIKDVIKRPAITFGMIAATLLIPLAVTSTKGWVRRLGKKWIKLHQLIYIIGALAVVHNIMMVKADLREPLIHLGILIILLGYRLARRAGFTYSMT